MAPEGPNAPESMNVVLSGKGDLEDVMKARILRRGDDDPGLSRWAHGHHKDPCKKEGGRSESRDGGKRWVQFT